MKYSYHDFLATYGIGGAHPGGIQLSTQILVNENLTSNHKVLEVGCGTGQTAQYIVKNFDCHMTVLDQHSLMLKKAADRFNKEGVMLQLVEGRAEVLPFEDSSFDYVLAESATIFTSIIPEFNVSESVSEEIIDIGGKHQEITMKYREKLQFAYFRAVCDK